MAYIYDLTLSDKIYYVDFPKGILAKACVEDYIREFFPKLLPKCVDNLDVFWHAMFETSHNYPRVYASIDECIVCEASSFSHAVLSQVQDRTWTLTGLENTHRVYF